MYVLKLAAVKSRPAGRETIRRARTIRLCDENIFFFSLYIACFRIMDQRLFGDDSRTGLSSHCHFKNTLSFNFFIFVRNKFLVTFLCGY